MADEFNPPWKMAPLNEWSIVGMNHYFSAAGKMLYVSMTKGEICITEEGADDQYLWSRLCHKAWKHAENRND